MSEPFIGEIRIFAGNFAPKDWQFCNGQILPIAQYTALFSLLGTYYGGNGTTNFALPNLTGRVPVSAGQAPGMAPYSLGETGGASTVTLVTTEMAAHTHAPLAATGAGTETAPTAAIWSTSSTRDKQFGSTAPDVQMAANILDPVGGGQAHENMAPYLVVNYIIAMAGIFPQRP